MRHVLGVLIGLVGAVVAVPLIGTGIRMALRSLQLFDLGPDRWLGALIALLGGLVLGAVVAAGRISVAAPLTAAAAYLLLTAAVLTDPFLLRDLGILDSPLSYVPLAGVLLLAPLAVRRRERPAAPAAAPWPSQQPPPPGWGPPPR